MRNLTLPGLEATLSVAGATLQEYDDENADIDATDTVVQYVEAVPGANFAINVRMDGRFQYRQNTLAVYVYLDGRQAEGKFLEMDHYSGRAERIISGVDGLVNGRWEHQRFTFAELKTGDGRPEAHLKEKLANFGEVSVKIYRCRKQAITQPRTSRFETTVDSSGIPEKALKGRAMSSRTALSKGEPIAPVETRSIDYPWGRDPVLTFTFKYRSHKDLQIEGAIPRSPSPVPLEERDPETLSVEEARELVRMQRQKLQDQAKIKKEKKEKREREEDDGEDGDGEVTMTGEQRKRQRLSNDSGIEVIDLSNEDDEDDD